MTPVRLEPADPQSRVKHSTTEPLRSHGVKFTLLCSSAEQTQSVNTASTYEYFPVSHERRMIVGKKRQMFLEFPTVSTTSADSW